MAKGWTTSPTLFADQIEADLATRVRVIAMAMLNEVVLRSPVDTGRFRGNNIVSIGAPVYAQTGKVDPTGAATISDGVSELSGLEPFTVVYIQNNLPYAERLENGHSKQAPSGIYGLAFIGVSEAYK
ncbi:HK97 gp10 family phage protein [Pseudomonas sp. GD03842]|uniref:HK97 gp10 family phage protein n=1 Tax=Pseudomonas sp. GD03842 TaxID=2975385 RepID=UPI00244A5E0B|nr:HK97 gp10 family phage protein [Pseudomonas sp. GD03842]MDH0749522.1 HK97 gp10 family phage protein [Pseudomonas sp. GD03842]